MPTPIIELLLLLLSFFGYLNRDGEWNSVHIIEDGREGFRGKEIKRNDFFGRLREQCLQPTAPWADHHSMGAKQYSLAEESDVTKERFSSHCLEHIQHWFLLKITRKQLCFSNVGVWVAAISFLLLGWISFVIFAVAVFLIFIFIVFFLFIAWCVFTLIFFIWGIVLWFQPLLFRLLKSTLRFGCRSRHCRPELVLAVRWKCSRHELCHSFEWNQSVPVFKALNSLQGLSLQLVICIQRYISLFIGEKRSKRRRRTRRKKKIFSNCLQDWSIVSYYRR